MSSTRVVVLIWMQRDFRRGHRVDNEWRDLKVVLHVLKGHGVPSHTCSRWGSVSTRREMSESVRGKVHEPKHPRRSSGSMVKLVRPAKPNAGT